MPLALFQMACRNTFNPNLYLIRLPKSWQVIANWTSFWIVLGKRLILVVLVEKISKPLITIFGIVVKKNWTVAVLLKKHVFRKEFYTPQIISYYSIILYYFKHYVSSWAIHVDSTCKHCTFTFIPLFCSYKENNSKNY